MAAVALLVDKNGLIRTGPVAVVYVTKDGMWADRRPSAFGSKTTLSNTHGPVALKGVGWWPRPSAKASWYRLFRVRTH